MAQHIFSLARETERVTSERGCETSIQILLLSQQASLGTSDIYGSRKQAVFTSRALHNDLMTTIITSTQEGLRDKVLRKKTCDMCHRNVDVGQLDLVVVPKMLVLLLGQDDVPNLGVNPM